MASGCASTNVMFGQFSLQSVLPVITTAPPLMDSRQLRQLSDRGRQVWRAQDYRRGREGGGEGGDERKSGSENENEKEGLVVRGRKEGWRMKGKERGRGGRRRLIHAPERELT